GEPELERDTGGEDALQNRSWILDGRALDLWRHPTAADVGGVPARGRCCQSFLVSTGHTATACGIAIGPSGPCTAFEYMNCTGTVPLPSVRRTSLKTSFKSVASSIGKSPHSSPCAEVQPRKLSSPVRTASSTSGSVRASFNSW